MHLCILQPTYEPDSVFKELDPPTDPTPYLVGHTWHRELIEKATAVEQVTELVKRGFDVFFNLCDGAVDEDRAGIEVVQTLERLGAAFTGATSAFYDPTRLEMKAACKARGVPAPEGLLVRSLEDLSAASRLRFPLIVKHPQGYASVGLTRASRVETPEALGEQGARALEAYGAALVEEFIEGREFTALVAESPDEGGEPVAYRPVEIRFPQGESFKHFDLKWKTFGEMSTVPCVDPVLSARLQDLSKRLFLGLNGTGYGRCDFRMSHDGELFLLEINPSCGVFYPDNSASADFILLHDEAGHRGFAETLIRAALKRARRPAAGGMPRPE